MSTPHIRERRPGVWQVMYDIDPDPVTGRRRQRSRTIKGTRADAEGLAAQLVADLADHVWVDDGKLRVTDLRAVFLENRGHRWTPSTAEWYRQKLSYLDPVAHRRAASISGGVLTALYARLLADGLSASTVAGVHRATRAMFRAAVKWGYVRADPTARAEPPTPKPEPIQPWTATELARFLEATVDDQWHVAWLLIAMTGMRRGELCGLEWANVDLDGGTVQVVRNVTEVSGHRFVGDPKTRSSRRTISLDAHTVELLKAWRTRHGLLHVGWVIAWPDGRPVNPGILSKNFRRTVDRLGLPAIRLHDLRHGWATLALEAGVHVRVVADRLGHSNPTVTLNTYTHAVARADREAAEQVADRVFRLGRRPGF